MSIDEAIPPTYESTGFRAIYLADGTRLPGRLAIQLMGELSAEDLPATSTPALPRRIGLSVGRVVTIESGTQMEIVTDQGQVLVKFAADGSGDALLGFFGHSPVLRPAVSAAGGLAALTAALVSLGLITATA